jgi:protein-arginine kinase activator protein McsA
MNNKICSECGKTYESFGLSSGPAICNECFTEKNPDIAEQEDISDYDLDNNSNSANNFFIISPITSWLVHQVQMQLIHLHHL